MSFTFILGRLADNKILLKLDPGYRARLLSLPRVDRERLLGSGQGGNWNIRPAAGLYFQRSWFRVIDAAPHERELVQVVRGWDKAATKPGPGNPDPCWTRGVKMGVTRAGRYVVLHVESLRGSPQTVLEAIRRMATQDGRGVKICMWQDPAQAGVVDMTLTKQWLSGYWVDSEIANQNKLAYAGPFSTQVEAGAVDIVRGPWNDEFLGELEAFPEGKHSDIVDASSRAFRALSQANVRIYEAAMRNIRDELTV